MLFMSTYTFEPAVRNEVVKRRLERGIQTAKGLKILGEWFYLGSHKGFVLFETDDPKLIMGMAMPWADLLKWDTVPVMEIEEVLKLAKSVK